MCTWRNVFNLAELPFLIDVQVLLRRTKNNVVLVGEPGVGKTAVVEGIAQMLASPAAPFG